MLNAISPTDVFFWTGVVATSLFVIKLIIFFFTGAGSEMSMDFNVITETDTSFNFLSIETVLSFLMGFGWVGLAFYGPFKMPGWMCIFAGVVFGLFFACLYTFLMMNIKKLDHKPEFNIEEAVGAEGKAYTNIGAHCEGQAELTINEKLSVVNVINDCDEEITAFTPVKVDKVENEKLYIVRMSEKNS